MVKINAKNIKAPKKIAAQYFSTDVVSPFVRRNRFAKMKPEDHELPVFSEVKENLPHPLWENHQDAIDCYWKAWEIAFSNLKKPAPESGFISNFIDTAFNDNLFMWDSAFIVMFGRYGSRVFNFQKTLDIFYAHQHNDGFICREIRERDGADYFTKFDVSSTGPNILPWAEWGFFLNFGDKERLAKVFYPLLMYYQWFKTHRSWQNGTYFSSGLGCGMDNQPRLSHQKDYFWYSHGHMSWIDTTLQQILAGSILIKMADVLDKQENCKDIENEIEYLKKFVNEKMWDLESAFYYDRFKDGTLSNVKSIGAFWALLADVVPKSRLKGFIAHLEDENEFNRPHRVPSLSADHPKYKPEGAYWQGGIWPPTNYMILKGLNKVGQDDLAFEIALNHLDNVVKVFNKTKTVWENYAPESVSQGDRAKKNFVGWTGLVPISVMFENVFGLRPNIPESLLIWDIRLLERHGVKNYPFGTNGLLNVECEARKDFNEEPKIRITSTVPMTLLIKWKEGTKTTKINNS